MSKQGKAGMKKFAAILYGLSLSLVYPLYCICAYREFVPPSIRLLLQSKNVNESKSANFLFIIEAVSECHMYTET